MFLELMTHVVLEARKSDYGTIIPPDFAQEYMCFFAHYNSQLRRGEKEKESFLCLRISFRE